MTRISGPDGYTDPPVVDAAGKDCNVFDGDCTGLALGFDDRINVVWTGLTRFVASPQIDAYTGPPHDGYGRTRCSPADRSGRTDCAGVGTIALTIVAGPLPEPSR